MAEWTLMGNRQTVYKEVISKTPDWWDRSILKKGEETITYLPIVCNHEPFEREEAELTPSGVGSTDSRWLYTEEVLDTYLDFDSDSSLASKVYLTNPEEGRKKPQAYVVYGKESWDATSGFEFISTGYDYIIIREGKL